MKTLNINIIKSIKAFFFYALVIFSSTFFTNALSDPPAIYSAKEKPEFIFNLHTVPFIDRDFIGFKEYPVTWKYLSDRNQKSHVSDLATNFPYFSVRLESVV